MERPRTAYEVGVEFYQRRIEEMRVKSGDRSLDDWRRMEAVDEGELAELKLKQLHRREHYFNNGGEQIGSGEYDITDPRVTAHFKELGS